MTPFEITTTTGFFENGLNADWDIPGEIKGMKIRLKKGGFLTGFSAGWDCLDGDGIEYQIYMLCVPEAGFASSTRVASTTVYSQKEVITMTLFALMAKMGDHGVKTVLRNRSELEEDD